MYLLQSATDNLNAFAAWGQFLAAGVTLFLLIKSTLQDSQIRKMTDMIDELRKQTGQLESQSITMRDSLALEQKQFRISQEPFFVIDKINDRVGYFEICVSNSGAGAQKVRLKDKPKYITEASVIKSPDDEKIYIHMAPLPQFDYKNFEFTIESLTKSGAHYKQLMIVEKGLMQTNHYVTP